MMNGSSLHAETVATALLEIEVCRSKVAVARIILDLPYAAMPQLAVACTRVEACRHWAPLALRIVPRVLLEGFVGRAEASRLYGEWL